ncbi:MAG: class I SAM-dependent methyltransferase, partial [Cyanothece sp. SIO1E1]|nr:class I SAM-dependent methyltransferase [Cyanothece sp. SIO1E1]
CAEHLTSVASVLDLGCGHGRPVSQTFVNEGHAIYGVDASPSMIAEFRANLPTASAECSSVEESQFFNRTFDAVVAWGLMFILPADVQTVIIQKVSRVLNENGQFLFTAPKEACEWIDSLTGRKSLSLGFEKYQCILNSEGFALVGEDIDEGGNYYYFAAKEKK